MNEHELKSALQDVMVASSPPPPMDAGAALDRGRRADRRRKATWAVAVAGLGVVAIAVGAVLVPNLAGGDGVQVAGGQSSVPASAPPMTSVPPSVTATLSPPPTSEDAKASTERPWPNGQGDRTSTNGPRADKSVAVLNDLGSSLPNGVEAVDKAAVGRLDYGPLRRTQSQFADYTADGLEIWEYLAYTPVVRGGTEGVGHLWMQVETKGNSRVEDVSGCGMVIRQTYPVTDGSGRCDILDVGGKQVVVVTAAGPENGMEQAAFYRYDDSTLVIVAQSREYLNSGHPALAERPLTSQQLAAIAVDPKFHLD
ncbi:cell wall assembly regulator SMI1 [Saccharothrix ecbatanensis]|uniref:Cell wall assembly regulator SMI1 n=1 Tax=Saccharothrix ecbatanensis TaxID=1105145 RepID=A0A7W9M2J0_9PSEU|nr:hypothetical protein [Saccharothrix ecbatanensis]MBB5805017.1 cell wall assembly regulator SMI1 [Saccharothrix ecbatanensis]